MADRLLRRVERERPIAGERAASQGPRAARRERVRLEPQLAAQQVRLRRVIGKQLAELVPAIGLSRLEQSADPVVQRRSISLRQRSIGDGADQKVLEPGRPARRIVAIGHEQALAGQRLRCHAHFAVERQELIECEVLTDHAGSLERDLFRRRQPVEPRRDDRLNGFRER